MSVLSIVITIVIIVLIIMLIRYIYYDPYTLQKLQNGQTSSTIQASDLATNGTDVASSNFSYSVWFYVNDWNYRYGESKVIFGRMGAKSPQNNGSIQGVSGLDPCPAVVLTPIENNLAISLGCYPGIDQQPTTPGGNTVLHTCNVSNVPIQKWVNLIISTYGRSLDVYIDGKLVRTCLLPGIATVNNSSNIFVTPAGGFDGWTSRLQYWPNSMNPQEAWNIYTRGPTSWANLNSYQLQISLVENGTSQGTVTI